MDPWQRQRSLARTTIVWSALSTAVGLPLMLGPDPWRRAFGRQQVGWAAIDLTIVAVAGALQRRRMRRAGNPYAPAVLAREAIVLHRVLLANVVADAGYTGFGAWLWLRHPDQPERAGAGAGIVVQGGFLALHDAFHAAQARAGLDQTG